MKEELKKILESIVTDLKTQGHDPLEQPIVFVWDYGEGIKFTLVIQSADDPDVITSAELH